MRLFVPVLAALVLATPALAGKRSPAPPPLEQTAVTVVGRALAARDTTWQRMQMLCDDIGHRLTGSSQLEKAVTWATEQMRNDGLQAVRAEPVPVKRWLRGEESLTLLGDVPRAVPLLGLGNAVGTDPAGLVAQVVVVDDWDHLERLGRDGVQGRIVLFDVPWTDYGTGAGYRVRGPSKVAALGGVAMLVRSVTSTSLATPHTGTLVYADDAPKIPAAAVDHETADQLRRLSERGKAPQVRLVTGGHFGEDTTSHNVVGEIKGREKPDEIVVLGCHLDSWDVGTGAQDDGAGCVAVMEAGRVLAGLGHAPRRTLRFVLFTNEENGGAGGTTYQEQHATEQTVAAIEMDTGAGPFLGYRIDARTGGDPDDDQAERERLVAALDPIKPLFSALGAPVWVPSFSGSDIMPLVKHGSLGVGLHMDTTGYWPIHHTHADTLDKIDRDHFQRDVAGMALIGWVLAEIERVPQPTQQSPGAP